ncbi:hypothetical protein BG015_011627 [Linnemannia schmuckeri]|uniref:Uncharacterized protein n=1 Tax=Linnemannia schmuckeri TaxID=64567 RepID=A0A9P5V8D4_9FUNG|nr:hypothetical protein BG015_011627 [Linnemannia schmuckeri]
MDDGDENGEILLDFISQADSIIIRVDKLDPSPDTQRQHQRHRQERWRPDGSGPNLPCPQHQYPDRQGLCILDLTATFLDHCVDCLVSPPCRPSRSTRWSIGISLTSSPSFKACPNIEELSIKPTGAVIKGYSRESSRHAHVTALTSSQEHDLSSGTNALSTPTRLQTYILHNLAVTLPALDAFLYIIRLVDTHCPNLKTFHLSMPYGSRYSPGLGSREVVAILETFPYMEKYNLTDEAFSPNLLKTLETAGLTNRITILNFLPTLQDNDADVRLKIPLSKILYSFENLVHLRTPNAVYCVEDMDLHDVLEQLRQASPYARIDYSSQHRHIPTDDPAVARKYIWACRELQTLHMSIKHQETHSIDAPMSSLIVFGFLSRMAPWLQELRLKSRRFNLTFEGGMALLARLQDLERIWIITDDIWRRYKGISAPEDATKGSMMVERDREQGMDLTKLGHSDDLLEWMDDYYMDYKAKTTKSTTTDPCHSKKESRGSSSSIPPKLGSFWIYVSEERSKEFFRKVEEDLTKKVRPNVDLQFCRSPQNPYYLTTLQLY